MGYLQGTKCYLGGPIEHDRVKTNWRPPVIAELQKRFGIDVFDPNADPKQNKSVEMREAKARGDWQTVAKIAFGFVRKDLGIIDRSDFTISRFSYEKIYYPEEVLEAMNTGRLPEPHLRQVPTTGTVHEIVVSNIEHKPALIVCELGIEYIPTWLLGFVSRKFLFGSWESLYQYLADVDNGMHKDDHHWSLVYKEV